MLLRHYLHASALLVVDEIGCLKITGTGAMLFFQLMTRRYERWQTLHSAQETEPASRRRRPRQEVATT